MIEIALRFGWMAQTIVVVAAVLLVFYKSFYEDWNKKSEKHKKIIPSSILKQYIADLNLEKDLVRNFHMPVTILRNGEQNIYYDIADLINYEGLKETGWKYSRIDSFDTLLELDNTAIIKLKFSRFNKSNEKYRSGNSFYTVTKQDKEWRISSIIFDPDIPFNAGLEKKVSTKKNETNKKIYRGQSH